MNETLLFSVTMPSGVVKQFSLSTKEPVLIGRDPTCHLVLPSPEVSRFHLKIYHASTDIVLEDHSANGTIVENTKIHKETICISEHTPFYVGPYMLSVKYGEIPTQDQYPLKQSYTFEQGNSYASQPTFVSDANLCKAEQTRHSEKDSNILHLSNVGASLSREMRRRIHKMLLEHMDLVTLDRQSMVDDTMRPQVVSALKLIVKQLHSELPKGINIEALIHEMSNEALGLGPLQALVDDDNINEIMVVHPSKIYVEKRGKMYLTNLSFTDDDAARTVIERIITPLGRRIDELNPLVDARLKDGSRVNAVIRPVAIHGACITIRKFRKNR